MKQRDLWKQRAKQLAELSEVACPVQIHAWGQYKQFRNQVNNRKKTDERAYKSQKVSEVADSPDLVWKKAKNFMGWKSQGVPAQIKVGNDLITSAKKIANIMNNFFVNKVETIRKGIPDTRFNLNKVFSIMFSKCCSLQMRHVSISKVRKTLKSLGKGRCQKHTEGGV